ncbi:MAG: fumarylacetoacetate hydrolase family protein [Desulfatiglandaceae bacterium]|jgi:2-keto-4-pentenoate hydratase/2-oxohepta-3-ene-1,7-dioic acid hydratase in catechol pathway
MKIAQFIHESRIKVGLVQEDNLLPLVYEGTMADLVRTGVPSGLETGPPLPLAEVRWAPAVSRPGKIIAVGLNYLDHAKESKGEIPEVPLVFAKFSSSLIGHKEDIIWDEDTSQKVDFEAELAVIIGKKIRNCPEKEALGAVFGYTCANDVSARDLQFGDGQWVRGKSLDTFCPLGPWIVPREAIPDPQDLAIRCWLNGRLMQDSRTSSMIFGISELISFMSRHFTLFPGDVILSGTPHGVGAFREPSVYLKNGDEVVVEIEAVGRLVNRCRISRDPAR